MPNDGSRARRNQAVFLHVAVRQPIEILHRNIDGIPDEFARGGERQARGTVELRPPVLAAKNEVREQPSGNGAIRQAVPEKPVAI